MRTSLNLPDEAIGIIRDRAEAAGISQAEWLRRVVLAACIPGAPLTADDRVRMEEAIRTVEKALTTVTTERDAFAARVTELEQLTRVAAAEVAAAIAERDRLADEQDRLEDERTRAKTKASAAAEERDQARAELRTAEDRARIAETRAAVAEAVAGERAEQIANILRSLALQA